MKRKKSTGGFHPRFLTLVLAVVLIITLFINSACVYDIFGRFGTTQAVKETEELSGEQKQAQAEREEEEKKEEEKQAAWRGEIMYTPVDMEVTGDSLILDNRDAEDVLEQMLAEIGIDDEFTSYRCADSKESAGGYIYRMQQYYKDVKVYGYELTMTVNDGGKLMNVSGTWGQISDLDVESSLSSGDGEKLAGKYIQKTYQMSEENNRIVQDGYYVFFAKGKAAAGYVYHIQPDNLNTTLLKVFVDGKSGEILAADFQIDYEQIEGSLSGQNGEQQLEYWKQSDTQFALKDEERNICIYTTENGSYNSGAATQKVEWEQGETPNASGVDALANLQRVYDYYQVNFGRMGVINDKYKELPVFVDIADYFGQSMVDNAGMAGTELMVVGTRSNGEPTYAAELNVMGHEYTHGVVASESQLGKNITDEALRQTSEENAINEGLADAFAELIEDWSDDNTFNNSCDWENSVRSLKKPSGSSLTDAEDYIVGTTDCHDGASIVSYAVYQMADKIATDTLGKMWYETIQRMPSSTQFQQLRNLFEMNAQERYAGQKKMSGEELEAVLDAFDSVGIDPSYQLILTKNAKLQVYDINNELYDNYHLKISEIYGKAVVDEDVKEKSYTLDLDAGLYQVTLTDLENKDLSYTYSMIVNDKKSGSKVTYDKKHSFYTSFGSVPRDVVLVLDCSGSMDGDPMKETKKAANEFVETVCKESPETRISIIQYSDDAYTQIEASNNKRKLKSAIRKLGSSGGTNMHAGISSAKEILEGRNADKQMIVLMSDGLPNQGQAKDGSYEQAVIDLADEAKKKNITMYSLGFFHNLSGEDRTSCQNLMESIATSGYYYEVTSAELVQFVFDDIAKQVSGKNYIYIRIACPVDVAVTKNGEVLSSEKKNLNTRTEFGSLTFEGEEEEVKILRLEDSEDYEVCIQGTGSGTMDYSISFADKNGKYGDERKFEDVPITEDTFISTNTQAQEATALKVDSDGDGHFDLTYKAGENEEGEVVQKNWFLYGGAALAVVVLLFAAGKLVMAVRRFKSNCVCPNCGSKIGKGSEFCTNCGNSIQRQPLFFVKREPQRRAVKVAKVVIMVIAAAITAVIVLVHQSAPTTAFMQIRNQEFVSAERVYENHVENKSLSNKYFNFITGVYFDRAVQKYEKGSLDRSFMEELCQSTAEMNLGELSDKAGKYLENLE